MIAARKRYNVGRYLKKKYAVKRTYKRRTPLYTKPITNDMISISCTDQDKINLSQDGSYRSDNTGNAKFRNLYSMLQASTEFSSRSTRYSFYKLTGMSVKFTRRWINPITYGVNGSAIGILGNTIHFGLPMLNVNFFPTESGVTHGAITENADSSWQVSPYVTEVQRHYIKFPTMVTGNGIGLNMWNPVNSYAQLEGQLSFYNDVGCVVSDVTEHFIIWDVEYNIYVQFCNNTGL